MTGFKEDMQAKILGTTSDVVVQPRGQQTMAGYAEVMRQVEEVPGVVAATPLHLPTSAAHVENRRARGRPARH